MVSQFFKENFALKILSLFMAVLLELYLYSPDNSTSAEFSVPIELRNISPLMTIVEPHGATDGLYAQLSIHGPSPLVEQVKSSNKKFVLDLERSTSSQLSLPLDLKQLRLPAGVRGKAEPASIHLRLERLIRKELPVVVEEVGNVKNGFVIQNVDIFPHTVIAHGPSSELEGVHELQADPIDVSNLSGAKQFEVALHTPGSMTNYAVNTVNVQVNVRPIDIQRELEDIPVTVLAPAGFAASVEPSKISITVSGPSEALTSLARGNIQIHADARGSSAGTVKLRPTVSLPQELRLVSSDPQEVTVTLTGAATHK